MLAPASFCPTSRLSPKTLVQAEDRYLPWRQKSLTRHTRVVVVWACSRLPHTTISLGCLRPLGPPAPLEKRTQQNFYVDSVLMACARSFSAAKEWMQARSAGVWTLHRDGRTDDGGDDAVVFISSALNARFMELGCAPVTSDGSHRHRKRFTWGCAPHPGQRRPGSEHVSPEQGP